MDWRLACGGGRVRSLVFDMVRGERIRREAVSGGEGAIVLSDEVKSGSPDSGGSGYMNWRSVSRLNVHIGAAAFTCTYCWRDKMDFDRTEKKLTR